MPFYYPNRNNDFWRVMGIVFYDNPDRFYDSAAKSFRLDDITAFATERGIALCDTDRRIRRLRGNASDAFLEIVEAIDLQSLIPLMPHLRAVASTGTLAAKVIASLTDTTVPPIGGHTQTQLITPAAGTSLQLWRMPSTSRAYPMKLELKARAYHELFSSLNLI